MLVALALLAMPSVAQADAGTPLMWAGALHFVFGNLLLGLLEGVLLAKVFALSTIRCIGLLIVANYFSAWLGGLIVSRAISRALPWNLQNAWLFFWLMVLITYVITVAFEFPFVALAFRGDVSWRRKAIRGSLLVQTVSYVLLFGWYWMASETSLYTQSDVVDLSAMSLPENVLLYFISIDDGDVYAGSVGDAKWRRVAKLNSTHRNDRLFVRPSTGNANSWDLVARLETDERRNPDLVTIEKSFAPVAAPSRRSANIDPPQYDGTWFNFGEVPKLGEAQASSWKFWSGFWPSEGLRGTETNTGRQISFSLETPFVAWSVRNATHIPSDKVLFQLGDTQICVYDPVKNRIALLAKGRGPIAVIREEKSSKTPAPYH